MSPARRLAAAVLFAGLAVAATVARADALLDGVAAIPGIVEDVRIGGTWDRDGESGVYRIIVARSGGQSVTARMFIQWVAYQDDGGAAVRDTIEIKEFAELNVDLVDYTSESDENGLSIVIQTLDPNGSNDLDYDLTVVSPTQYKFGPASN